jgi:hypothetical protein
VWLNHAHPSTSDPSCTGRADRRGGRSRLHGSPDPPAMTIHDDSLRRWLTRRIRWAGPFSHSRAACSSSHGCQSPPPPCRRSHRTPSRPVDLLRESTGKRSTWASRVRIHQDPRRRLPGAVVARLARRVGRPAPRPPIMTLGAGVRAPDLVDEHPPCQHTPRPRHQQRQQLDGRARNSWICPPDTAPLGSGRRASAAA